MIVLISLSLIIPFLMILSAQKWNYETELERIQEGRDFTYKLIEERAKQTKTKIESVKRENLELKAKLETQERNYETELDRISADCSRDVILSHRKAHELSHENLELKAKLETQELKVMRSCRNWSKMARLKCAINPTGSCLECRDYEVLGK